MVQHILNRLKKVRQTGSQRWTSCCPAHNDRTPSLGIRQCDDGRLLVNCLAGCAVEDVLAAIGLTTADLFPEKPPAHHSVKRERMLWHPQDVMKAMAFEVLVAKNCANKMAAGELLTPEELGRLSQCAVRLQRALEAIHG